MNASTGTGAYGRTLDFSWTRRLPLIRQSETTECGLACLAMIAAYHGNRAGLGELRRRFQLSARGLNLAELVELAARLGFSARPLRTDLGAVSRLQLPCILHWDMNHFVVLKRVRRRYVVILDPARGASRLTLESFSRHFTGIALELTPSDSFTTETAGPALRLSDLWTRITGLGRSLAQVLLLSMLLQCYVIATPFYTQTVVDEVVLRGDTGLLTALALGFILLLAIETGTQALRGAVILQLSSRLHLQLASNLFRHLVQLPATWFERRHLGDILSRFSSLESIREILSVGLVTAAVDGLMALAMLAIMFLYDVHLTLIVLLMLAFYGGLQLVLYPLMRRLSQQSIARHALGETVLIESLRCIQTVKLFQQERARERQWHNRLADAMNTDIRIARLEIIFQAANTALIGSGTIAVVYYAAHAIMANQLSLGMLFAFLSYKRRFTGAAESLIHRLVEVRMMGLHLLRISDIALADAEPLAAPPIEKPNGATPVRPVFLRCRGLAWRHSETAPWLFQSINLAIDAATCVAITGPSGAGKSTLLKCLMGLLPATRGEILVDGVAIESAADYRCNIAAVMQDDQLFSGSIAENISCFDDVPEPDRIVQCAQVACIHDEITRMPMQYNTRVGDMGVALSGGQIQRVMLARAVYRRPSILFLDEATSHVDIDTERRINRHVAGMRMTRVIVSHRADSLDLADTVVTLRQEGCIAVSRHHR